MRFLLLGYTYIDLFEVDPLCFYTLLTWLAVECAPRRQLITEQLPIRKDQLYNKYGPGGDTPLIPDAQPRDVSLSIGAVSTGSDGFVEVVNDNDIAVDVSGWKLSGGGVTFTFVPGTVIPPKDSVYVAASSIGTFKGRGSAPSGGQGLFVVGPMEGTPSGPAGISISSS